MMLQIRLNKGTSLEGGTGGRHSPVETVTVACPDHLVLADLPVAKGIGGATAASRVKTVGRRSRRVLGERVHFCVQCDFPIAIYGRLNPCEHVFCLDCARSDSICYLCDERVQKIQTIKMMEGIFICAAPHCLKSFLKKTEFVSHMHKRHSDILPNAEKEDGNESEAQTAKQSAASESTARGPSRPINPSGSSSQLHHHDERTRRQQPREHLPPMAVLQPRPPQYFGQVQNYPSEPRPSPPAQGFDRPGHLNHFPQQGVDMQGMPHEEAGHQGILVQTSTPENQLHSMQHPGFATPVNSNPMMTPAPPYGFPSYPTDGAQQFYGAPYEIQRLDSAPEVGSDQRSLLGFPPGPANGANFTASAPQPWNADSIGFPYEHGQNPGALPLSSPPVSLTSKGMEAMQGGNAIDPRDGKGILAPQLLHPPPPPPHAPQVQRAVYYSGDMVHDGQGHRWHHDSHDGFGGGQE